MKKPKLPRTDSIKKLAEFWDTHDVTDFEEELEEVTEPLFGRESSVLVSLPAQDAKAVERIAQAKGVSQEQLIQGWVHEKLAARPRRSSIPRT
jgi:hypothetical protein